jgi:two-component system phosphate regulon sensor histidine kinase PhoR
MVEDMDNITRFAAEIHQSANRLLSLINDIIRLSELDNNESSESFEAINLYEVAQACIDMLQITAAKHQVALSVEGEAAYVSSTRQMMEELIFNLCQNAIRYNNENGKVAVSVKRQRGKVVLQVKDNGIGIPREHQERIFERFYRVDKGRSKSTGGTGLGLAIVKHILARHDAELELESEVGRGTKIKVNFKEA